MTHNITTARRHPGIREWRIQNTEEAGMIPVLEGISMPSYMEACAIIMAETNEAAVCKKAEIEGVDFDYIDGWLCLEPTREGRELARSILADLESYPLLDEDAYLTAEREQIEENLQRNDGRDILEMAVTAARDMTPFDSPAWHRIDAILCETLSELEEVAIDYALQCEHGCGLGLEDTDIEGIAKALAGEWREGCADSHALAAKLESLAA